MDPQKKQLSVRVTDMREGHDYHLRLCRRDFICIGMGAKTLVRCSQAYFRLEVLDHSERNGIMLEGLACPLRLKRRKQSRAPSYHIPDLCPAFASRYDGCLFADYSLNTRAKLFILIKTFITGMVGCRRCSQSPGLPLQRP